MRIKLRLGQAAFREASGYASRWSVGKKLGGVFAALALILLGVGALSSSLLWDASTSLSQSGGQYLPVLQLSMAFEREILSARTQFIFQITAQKPGAQEAGWDHFRKAREMALKLRAQVTASSELAGFISPVEQMVPDLNAYEALLGRILEAVEAHQNEGALFTALVQDWTRVDARLADTAAEFNREAGEQAVAASRRYAGKLDSSAQTAATACFLAGIVGTLLGGFLALDLNRSLKLAASELNTVADQFAAASKVVVAVSNLLVEGATEQTSSLREVAASCGEIDSMIRKGEMNAQSLALAAAESKQASESGMEALGGMTRALKEIAASHAKVFDIVNVVDSLAAQTNLLAMKAAVEANRSAEAAKALAVLAGEVGDLAQRSAQSAKDTAAAVELTATAVSVGSGHAETIAGTLSTVAVEATCARGLADEIGSERSGQAQGIERIARAVSQVETVTKAVTAGAGQAAAASAELSSRAATMKNIAGHLAVLAGGTARYDGASPASNEPEPDQGEPITAGTEA
jgi:methyl-accepting chemotaxis protein